MIEALHRYLDQHERDYDKSQGSSVEAIVTFWLDTNILRLFNAGNKTYVTFRHTLFREYAAAQNIAALSQRSFQRTWQFLVPRLHHAAWQSSLFMLIQLLERSQRVMLIERLLQGVSPYEGSLYRDFRLAVRLLNEDRRTAKPLSKKILQQIAELSASPGHRRQVIARLTYIIGTTGLLSGGIAWFSPKTTAITILLWSLAWVFSRIRPILPRIQSLLSLPQRRSPSVPQRNQIVELLAQYEASEGLPYLLQALHDDEPEVRKTAANIIGNLGEVEPVPVLIDMLHDRQETVRRTAALALGKIGAIRACFRPFMQIKPKSAMRLQKPWRILMRHKPCLCCNWR
jgi:hypothetical protein